MYWRQFGATTTEHNQTKNNSKENEQWPSGKVDQAESNHVIKEEPVQSPVLLYVLRTIPSNNNRSLPNEKQ